MPSCGNHFHPGHKAALGTRLHLLAMLNFHKQPGSHAQLTPQWEGRGSQPESQSSPASKHRLAPVTCTFWKASAVQYDQVCASIWAGF